MRNALLILASAAALLGLVWWWLSVAPDRSTPPLAAKPVATSPLRLPPPAAPSEATPSAAEPTPPVNQRLNTETETDPAAALGDIEQADRPDHAQDPQRRALEIFALVRQGRVGHARALADRFYRAFPGNPEIPQIERLTGYHPRPYGPGNVGPK